MSDNDESKIEDGEAEEGGEESSKKKKGAGLKALLPTILKFVAIGLGALVFIVTVVIITTSILNKGGKGQTGVPEPSSAYMGQRPEYQWFTNLSSIRTRTKDTTAHSVVVEIVIGYDLNDNAAQAELIARTPELQDFLRSFFSGKYGSELKPENEFRLKQEILENLNTRILTRSQVRNISFRQLEVMEM
ncbi:flagellar basal body protein FliL [Spirochaetia bacterium]|nr:flagellar basal body protein FliL [Spirochaetia bacterium]